MNLNRRLFAKILASASLLFASTLVPFAAQAADYPERDVTYVIPYNPGGESDVTARMQQKFFKELTGHNLIILNKPGAGGATAWAQLNGFKADGYTIMGTIVPHIILQPAMKEVGYQTEDITNVFFFHYTPDAIIVNAESEFKTLQDLVDFASANPGAVTMGGSGTNTANHLAAEIVSGLTSTVTTYIPFKGSAPAITALLGNQIKSVMSYTTQGVKAGDQVRSLAVATEKRHPALPDVPTFRELGINHVGGAYRGVAVPKGTPEDIQLELAKILAEINANPEFQKLMLEAGYSVIDVSHEQIPTFMAQKAKAYAGAIKQLKAKQ